MSYAFPHMFKVYINYSIIQFTIDSKLLNATDSY